MKNDQKSSPLPKTTSLADKQSVRTTFKLSERCINDLNQLSETYNLKPKELFDLICIDAMIDSFDLKSGTTRGTDNNLSVKWIRKTFVISKGALRIFKKKSEKFKISRDSVVERIILGFKALLDSVTKAERKKEEQVPLIISDFMDKAYEIEDKLKSLLGDNPILDRFSSIIVVSENLRTAIQSKLKDNVPVDPDDQSQS